MQWLLAAHCCTALFACFEHFILFKVNGLVFCWKSGPRKRSSLQQPSAFGRVIFRRHILTHFSHPHSIKSLGEPPIDTLILMQMSFNTTSEWKKSTRPCWMDCPFRFWNKREQPTHKSSWTILFERKTQTEWSLIALWNPTTSFLTATTWIYAIGAGITAAAGTRLALQLFVDNWFMLFSFQSQSLCTRLTCVVIYCHYLPVSGFG